MKKKVTQTITCPNCHTNLNIEDLVISQFSDSIRKDIESDLQRRVDALNLERSNFEELTKQFNRERKDFSNILTEQVKQQVELKEQLLKTRIMQESNQRFKLEATKLKEKLDLENSLQLQEKELVISTLRTKLEDATKTLNNKSQQLIGEAQEITIENFLQEHFEKDVVEPIRKGKIGGDCLLKINLRNQHVATILVESKRTASFSKSFIDKLKEDGNRVNVNANALVLISKTLPKDFEGDFALVDGVWITRFSADAIRNLFTVLRYGLIKVYAVTRQLENSGTKTDELFKFISSPEFKAIYDSILSDIKSIEDLHQQEEEKLQVLFQKRSRYLKTLLNNAINLYSSIQGIGVIDDTDSEYQSAS